VDVSKEPSNYLEAWRKRRGWSQYVLADKIDVSHQTIGRMESGESDIKQKHLVKLSKVLGVPRFAILEIDPNTAGGSITAEMLETWERIAPGHREAALTQLKAFAASFPAKKAS